MGSGIYLSFHLTGNTKYCGLFRVPSTHFSKRKADFLNLLLTLEKSLLNFSLNSNVFAELPLIILVV